MTIPQSFIQELIARADVVEIVGRHVPLKKNGANFMGLCPFHSENSPSFSVSPTKQFYHCFGCGKHGNAIGFLMEHAGMGFVEAVQDLAQQYGLQVPEDDAPPGERERIAAQREKQGTLSEVLERAAAAYRKHLRQSPAAIDYLKARGLSGEIAKRFGLGYAPPGWRTLAGVFPAYDDALLAESGLVIVGEDDDGKRYDRFRDRIVFPIRNVKGECIGFGGRVLGDEKPKYLNSPETPVFSKGQELYGLYEARAALRERGHALVTEGYMDVVALAQLGFPNAVATLGTACTAAHLQKLFRFTDAVVFSFDGDAAGRRAARKALDAALPYASDVRSVKFLFLPAEHDPDSFVRAFGAEAFARCVDEAMPLSRFLLEAAREGCDLGSAEGRAHLASNARALWSALPEGALRQQILGDIAAQVQLDGRELTALWARAPGARAPAIPVADSYSIDSTPRLQDGRHGPKTSSSFGRTRERPGRGAGRVQPLARADIAARLLLASMAQWEALSHEMHALLCDLPGAHGLLFAWLDRQLHEHGVQPWAALREGMRGQEFESLAERLMTGADGAPMGDAEGHRALDAAAELRSVLDFMLDEHLMARQTEAIAAVGSDPQALERYKALEARRIELRQRLRASLHTA
ncbi:MAG: primase [Variovorax sp.]|nr:primase [Variovorax sp.]